MDDGTSVRHWSVLQLGARLMAQKASQTSQILTNTLKTPSHKKSNTFNTKFVEYESDVAMSNTFTRCFSEGCLIRQTLSIFSFNRLPRNTF